MLTAAGVIDPAVGLNSHGVRVFAVTAQPSMIPVCHVAGGATPSEQTHAFAVVAPVSVNAVCACAVPVVNCVPSVFSCIAELPVVTAPLDIAPVWSTVFGVYVNVVATLPLSMNEHDTPLVV
jgi:hypothetical protein